MDWTAKILKIDNTREGVVDFWVSANSDASESFILSIPALEPDKTVRELMEWAYAEWLKRYGV